MSGAPDVQRTVPSGELLGAPCHIDLQKCAPASARLRTVAQLAELAAWCVETRAW
ncbi:hypothetical protein [Nonomuraea sp. NPDC048901]|uniref:hypothetical protein n=1 Tax=Nonomuraea sp. NPDC048901 TaxID=3155627 RepID=UPI0033F16B4F